MYLFNWITSKEVAARGIFELREAFSWFNTAQMLIDASSLRTTDLIKKKDPTVYTQIIIPAARWLLICWSSSCDRLWRRVCTLRSSLSRHKKRNGKLLPLSKSQQVDELNYITVFYFFLISMLKHLLLHYCRLTHSINRTTFIARRELCYVFQLVIDVDYERVFCDRSTPVDRTKQLKMLPRQKSIHWWRL